MVQVKVIIFTQAGYMYFIYNNYSSNTAKYKFNIIVISMW
jgi:hypothetical protein